MHVASPTEVPPNFITRSRLFIFGPHPYRIRRQESSPVALIVRVPLALWIDSRQESTSFCLKK
jgi:hypothetical protein